MGSTVLRQWRFLVAKHDRQVSLFVLYEACGKDICLFTASMEDPQS